MTPEEYSTAVLRTESTVAPFEPGPQLWRLLHAGMGMVTEAAEFLDQLKKHIYYGKPLDVTNLKEEVGDSGWYTQIAVSALETTIETEWERNIKKLRTRYPDKFTAHDALNRDLESEGKALEGEG